MIDRFKNTIRPQKIRRANAFSLLELLLAMSLTVLVTAMIGYLLQIYVAQSEGASQRIQQSLAARKILTSIGNDLRGVVRNQPFDTSALSEMLNGPSSSGGGGAGGGGAGGGGTGGGTGGSPTSPSGPSAQTPSPSQGSNSPPAGGQSSGGGQSPSGGGSSGGGSSSSMTGASGQSGQQNSSDPSATQTAPLPPGIYGTSTMLQLDVSRLPRPDQYFPETPDLLSGRLTDVPSDTKTVSYFVQAPTTMGVIDPLATSTGSVSGSGGLIRRQLDRSISQWANNMGQSDRMNRTGEMFASEVVAIDFSYFDGQTWQTSWDSSEQGLPWIVEVRVAMQEPMKAKTNPVSPGISLTMITSDMMSEYGIQVYSSTVAIPGAQLLSSPQAAAGSGNGSDSSNGMSSMGLN